MKDFRYIYSNKVTNSTSLHCNATSVQEVNGVSAASGVWENYHVADEHACIKNLFLNAFMKMVNFLWNCQLGYEFWMLE
jgi:hypothetical protein